jgi:Flp pilus assembly protein TadB
MTTTPSAPSTPARVEPTPHDSTDRERSSSRRETILLTVLVGLAVAVVLVGLAFPGLLAPAAAVAVLAAIVALEWGLPSGELRLASRRRSIRGR